MPSAGPDLLFPVAAPVTWVPIPAPPLPNHGIWATPHPHTVEMGTKRPCWTEGLSTLSEVEHRGSLVGLGPRGRGGELTVCSQELRRPSHLLGMLSSLSICDAPDVYFTQRETT